MNYNNFSIDKFISFEEKIKFKMIYNYFFKKINKSDPKCFSINILSTFDKNFIRNLCYFPPKWHDTQNLIALQISFNTWISLTKCMNTYYQYDNICDYIKFRNINCNKFNKDNINTTFYLNYNYIVLSWFFLDNSATLIKKNWKIKKQRDLYKNKCKFILNNLKIKISKDKFLNLPEDVIMHIISFL